VVDEILYEEEVLVKPLKPPLVRIRNIAGATVLGSGKAVPILNVVDLIKTARRVASSVLVPAPPNLHSKKKKRKILVVEDSITSRMLLKNILESAGYQVRTAVDGVDAYTVLREEDFELVVSDVEMPRMNGYDLTLQIRADKRLAELPVVLVTALGSRDERERGIDAGANAYIVKSNFEQSDLLETVRRLV
jgi:two-component system chemotaxis sensor kinase CheA